jgi:hypothetical protein
MFLMCAFTFTIGSPIALRSARAPNDSIVAEGWPDCKSLKFLVPTLNAPDLIRMVRKTAINHGGLGAVGAGNLLKTSMDKTPALPTGKSLPLQPRWSALALFCRTAIRQIRAINPKLRISQRVCAGLREDVICWLFPTRSYSHPTDDVSRRNPKGFVPALLLAHKVDRRLFIKFHRLPCWMKLRSPTEARSASAMISEAYARVQRVRRAETLPMSSTKSFGGKAKAPSNG